MKMPIIFNDTLAATTGQTVVSRRITYKFRILKITINFPVGTERFTHMLLFVSNDAQTANDVVPNGLNIFEMLADDPKLRGSGNTVEMDCDIEIKERGKYLHMYCLNVDTNAHSYTAVVEIENIAGRR